MITTYALRKMLSGYKKIKTNSLSIMLTATKQKLQKPLNGDITYLHIA